MPGAVATGYAGSPARHAAATATATATAAPHSAPSAGGPLVGSFSPSDAGSSESEAAEDLLQALHLGHALPVAATGGGVGAGVGWRQPPVAPVAAADEDGIDDVLRLQPWLLE